MCFILCYRLRTIELSISTIRGIGTAAFSPGGDNSVGTYFNEIPLSRNIGNQEALVADILSTALYVMGVDEGIAWAEKHGIAGTFLIPDDGGRVEVRASSLFEEMFLEN